MTVRSLNTLTPGPRGSNFKFPTSSQNTTERRCYRHCHLKCRHCLSLIKVIRDWWIIRKTLSSRASVSIYVSMPALNWVPIDFDSLNSNWTQGASKETIGWKYSLYIIHRRATDCSQWCSIEVALSMILWICLLILRPSRVIYSRWRWSSEASGMVPFWLCWRLDSSILVSSIWSLPLINLSQHTNWRNR